VCLPKPVKCDLTITKTLAYYSTGLITAIKSFMMKASVEKILNKASFKFCVNQPAGLYYKCFMIIIYDCNDSGQYYNTTIMIVIDHQLILALASVINYDHK
jgi:hypothetical protein